MGSSARRRRNKKHSHLSLNWERDTCKHVTLGMKKQGAFGAGSADESPLRRQAMWQLMWKGNILHHRWCGGNDLWRELLMDWTVLQRVTSRKPRGYVATWAFLQFEHCLSAIISFKIFNVKTQLLLNSIIQHFEGTCSRSKRATTHGWCTAKTFAASILKRPISSQKKKKKKVLQT